MNSSLLHQGPPSPAPWTAWRTYITPDGGSKTLVLNQSNLEFLLLDDIASECWAVFCERLPSWTDVMAKLPISQADLLEFADELAMAGLLLQCSSKHELDVPHSANLPSDIELSIDLEREMMQWVAENGFVYAAHWELTYRCNELCVHCYNPGAAHTAGEKPKRDTNELSTQEAKQLLRELVDIGVFRLTLSGGEATLRSDFVELLAYARQLGFQVIIYTNGLKISPVLLDRIAQLYPASVEISVHSADSAQHDAVTRVPGSFEKSMRSLASFQERGVHTSFKSSLTNGTIGNWKKTLELGESSRGSVILNTIISPGVDGKEAPLVTAPTFAQLVILAATPGSPLYVGGELENWGHSDLPAPNQKPCGAGHSSIAITPEGALYPCISFPLLIGHFRQNGVRHLKRLPPVDTSMDLPTFTSKDSGEILDQWRSIRIENLIDCGKHERCHYCGDLCPGDALVQTGSPLKAAENHCSQAYARMTAGQHLREGYSLETLSQKFGISAEFGRETTKTKRIIKLHPVQ